MFGLDDIEELLLLGLLTLLFAGAVHVVKAVM
jgi:hypothetical protein